MQETTENPRKASGVSLFHLFKKTSRQSSKQRLISRGQNTKPVFGLSLRIWRRIVGFLHAAAVGDTKRPNIKSGIAVFLLFCSRILCKIDGPDAAATCWRLSSAPQPYSAPPPSSAPNLNGQSGQFSRKGSLYYTLYSLDRM